MAVAGFALPVYLGLPARLPWHFWPAVVFCYAVFPVLGILMLVKLGYLKDLHIYEQKKRNRSYPLAMAGGALGWIYLTYLAETTPDYFSFAMKWTLAINVVLFLLWVINASWKKVSAHMTGTGGFLAACVVLVLQGWPAYALALTALLLNALVYTARIGLSAHSHIELLSGFALGFITIFAFLQL